MRYGPPGRLELPAHLFVTRGGPSPLDDSEPLMSHRYTNPLPVWFLPRNLVDLPVRS